MNDEEKPAVELKIDLELDALPQINEETGRLDWHSVYECMSIQGDISEKNKMGIVNGDFNLTAWKTYNHPGRFPTEIRGKLTIEAREINNLKDWEISKLKSLVIYVDKHNENMVLSLLDYLILERKVVTMKNVKIYEYGSYPKRESKYINNKYYDRRMIELL